MNRSHTLIVYFSRSGGTRRVAQALGRVMSADIEEIGEATARAGTRGYLRSAVEAAFAIPAIIEVGDHDPRRYDLVVVGSPVWVGSLASPVRAYLGMNRKRIRRVAFFVTHGGTGSAHTFRQMRALCVGEPVATVVIREQELADDSFRARVDAFASTLGVPSTNSRGAAADAGNDVVAYAP